MGFPPRLEKVMWGSTGIFQKHSRRALRWFLYRVPLTRSFSRGFNKGCLKNMGLNNRKRAVRHLGNIALRGRTGGRIRL